MGFKEHAVCVCVFVPPFKKDHSHAFYPEVHECTMTELCALYARHSSGLQLACSPHNHTKKIIPNVFVLVCV